MKQRIGKPILVVNRQSDTKLAVRCDNVAPIMKTLGQRIKFYRDQAGLTQKQLATKAYVSQPTIAELESGMQQSTRKLPAIAKALRVSIADLDPDFKKEWLGEGATMSQESIRLNVEYLEQVVDGALGMFLPNEAASALRRLLFELALEPPTPSAGPDFHRSLAEREVRKFLKSKLSER
jgi:transcriptional regulator with XRE-family HTH domain